MASRKVVVRVLVYGKDKSHLVEQLFILEKLLAPDPTCQPPIRLTSLGRDHNEAARGGALTRGELPGAGSWPWLDLSILQVGSGLGRADRLTVPLGACRGSEKSHGSFLSIKSRVLDTWACYVATICLFISNNLPKLVYHKIAVKRLKSWSNKAEKEFAVEVEILARVRHKSLLSLRGYCAEGQERLIVYDYMPNLSIHSQIHGQHAAECNLSWERRMKIAVDSAEGIAYLHHYATPHIIHRDVKASNVLLDSNFQARVADFGFAKLIPDGATHVTTKVKGTLGYLAPEYAMLGKASESCDVFSFGIMLLELASGKKPVEKLNPTTKKTITEWALPLARDKKFKEIADPKLKDNFVEDELKRMVFVGLACSQDKPEQRPIMSEVVELLKGESTEKLSNLENDDLFKPDSSFQSSSGPDSSDCVTEERSPKADAIEEAVDSSETVPSAR
ncbi:unnamed protein product [Miscanthus lutarioriparius]|uniref:Protein kinase domain-containing protein n=1 Tax=Miscanthus lutarioriparius TaxID=422564 RepID=A0A811Q6K9_9POAL|nr:unnamed protein product [Miscanthus lutarioriparius]